MSTAPEELIHEADAARARLLEVVDALDAKRHALKTPQVEKRSLVKELALPTGAAASGAGALVGAQFVEHDGWQAVLRSLGIALLAYGVFESLKTAVK